MDIGGLARSSTVDFPGKLSCVVFVHGCNLDCFYCHNRELFSPAGSGARREEGGLSEADVLAFLEKRAKLLDGVVVSGGEPTLQPDLAEFVDKVRAFGYTVKLDTNGQRPQVVREMLDKGTIDYFAIDYKCRAADYRGVCKGDAEKTLQTISMLLDAGADFEVRTTVYPGMDEALLAEALLEVPRVPRYRLNAFVMPQYFRESDRERLELPALTRKALAALVPGLRKIQPNLLDVS